MKYSLNWLLDLALILPLLYLFQASPHGHQIHPHAEPHAEAHAEASHTASHSPFSHDHSETAPDHSDIPDHSNIPDQSDQSHHHHTLTHHLDFHLLQSISLHQNSDSGVFLKITPLHLNIEDDSMFAGFCELRELIPDPVPPSPMAPRGPPLLA